MVRQFLNVKIGLRGLATRSFVTILHLRLLSVFDANLFNVSDAITHFQRRDLGKL